MVLLRKYRTEDVDSIARHAGNEKVARWMRDSFPHPYTRQDAETFIASCIAREGQGQLVRTIEVDGAAVGSIGVFVGGDVYCKSGELGYWLGEAYWGRGIMTQAVRQICEEAFSAAAHRCRTLCGECRLPQRTGKGWLYAGGNYAPERV